MPVYPNILSHIQLFKICLTGIVELHGGKLNVFSAGEGQGCTFTMELPVEMSRGRSPNSSASQSRQHSLSGMPVPKSMQEDGDVSASLEWGQSYINMQDLAQRSSPPAEGLSALYNNSAAQLGGAVEERLAYGAGTHQLPMGSNHGDASEFDDGSVSIGLETSTHTGFLSPPASQHGDGAGPVISRGGPKKLVSGWNRVFHFLVVDDSVTNRKSLARMLSSHGHTVHTAVDGLDGLNKLYPISTTLLNQVGTQATTAIHVDAILMDSLMPRMNGSEATRRLRELGFTGLIFGLTGNVFDEDIKEFKDAGADEVLSKPLNLSILKKLMNESKLDIPSSASTKLARIHEEDSVRLKADVSLSPPCDTDVPSNILPDSFAVSLPTWGEAVVPPGAAGTRDYHTESQVRTTEHAAPVCSTPHSRGCDLGEISKDANQGDRTSRGFNNVASQDYVIDICSASAIDRDGDDGRDCFDENAAVDISIATGTAAVAGTAPAAGTAIVAAAVAAAVAATTGNNGEWMGLNQAAKF